MDEADEVAEYNVARWRALAEARALYTRPLLDLDAGSAREVVNRGGRLGDLSGRGVLCLAGGGGRESAAFAVLGARVTVFDLSEEQLERDRAAAAHYRAHVETLRGDMRDLSALHGAGFDVVWHAYSINFVPDARAVFREVSRVVRPGGLYRFMCANPFVMGASTRDWDGRGYALAQVYADGAQVEGVDEAWVYERAGRERIPPPREYRHGLGTIVGGLAAHGFRLLEASEDESVRPDSSSAPGTWDHFVSVVRPWLTFLSRYEPAGRWAHRGPPPQPLEKKVLDRPTTKVVDSTSKVVDGFSGGAGVSKDSDVKLTKFELEVMGALWELGSASVREVQERLPEKRRPAYTTVQTIVYRLEEKGAVRRVKKVGNAHVFEPVVTRRATVRRLFGELLGFFGGSPRTLMAQLVEAGHLTLEDLREAEETLERLESERGAAGRKGEGRAGTAGGPKAKSVEDSADARADSRGRPARGGAGRERGKR